MLIPTVCTPLPEAVVTILLLPEVLPIVFGIEVPILINPPLVTIPLKIALPVVDAVERVIFLIVFPCTSVAVVVSAFMFIPLNRGAPDPVWLIVHVPAQFGPEPPIKFPVIVKPFPVPPEILIAACGLVLIA